MPVYSFKLPDIGEGIAEAEIVAWHAQVGDELQEDDLLCDLMTDKATVEMTAPVSGRLASIAGGIGDQIAIGAILATFETGGSASEGGQTPAEAALSIATAAPDTIAAPYCTAASAQPADPESSVQIDVV